MGTIFAGTIWSASDVDLAEVLPEFGAAHLFIDDCPDAEVWCSRDGANVGSFGVLGHCYSVWEITCLPCSPWWEYADDAVSIWKQTCNRTFYRECEEQCIPKGVCSFSDPCSHFE